MTTRLTIVALCAVTTFVACSRAEQTATIRRDVPLGSEPTDIGTDPWKARLVRQLRAGETVLVLEKIPGDKGNAFQDYVQVRTFDNRVGYLAVASNLEFSQSEKR